MDEENPVHGRDAPQGAVVMVDPARVARFSAVRPISPETVERILVSIRDNSGFQYQHAVTGWIEQRTGDVFIRDGAHRCMAVLLGRHRNLPGFREMLVPMVVLTKETVDSCEATLAVQSNEATNVRKAMTFPDYVAFLVRIRDTAHRAMSACDTTPLAERTWTSVAEWTSTNGQPGARERIRAMLGQKQLAKIYVIAQALLSTTLSDAAGSHSAGDFRSWDMFRICCGIADSSRNVSYASASLPFPPVRELFTGGGWSRAGSSARVAQDLEEDIEPGVIADILSRRSLDCAFFRGHPRRARAASAANLFYTDSASTRFEQVLFMSAVYKMRSAQQSTTGVERPRKKAKTPGMCTFQSSDDTHGQRLGFSIRCIVDAWDRLARLLGYADAETMVAPYIIFDRESVAYVHITTPHVWAPVAERSRLLHGSGPHNNRELADTVAREADQTLDSQLRVVAQRFLQDVMRWSTGLEGLFGDTTTTRHAVAELKRHFSTADDSGNIEPPLRRFIHTLPALSSRLPAHLCSSASAPQVNRSISRAENEPVPAHSEPDEVSVTAQKSNVSQDARGGSRTDREISRRSRRNLSGAPESSSDLALQEKNEIDDASGSGTANSVSDAIGDAARFISRFSSSYNVCFRGFIEAHKNSCGEDLTGKVQLVLTDPPYNTRSERALANSNYDFISPADVEAAAGVITSLLRPGGHAVIFCSVQQFENWKSELEKDETMMVDAMPLLCIRAPTAYYQPPIRKSTTLVNMYECAVHATKYGEGKDGWDMVSYREFGHVSSRFRGWCNVIDNVPKPAAGEAVVSEISLSQGRGQIRFEQKPEPLMRELVCRFSMPQDVVVDLFAGTYTTAVACLTISDGMYRRFAGCERDRACHEAVQTRIYRAFSEQYKNGSFGPQTEGVSEFLQSYSDAVRSRFRRTEWIQPAGFPVYSCLPKHIIDFLGILLGNLRLGRDLGKVPVDRWPVEVQEKLEDVCPKVLRAIDCAHFGLCVKPSTILSAGEGVFAGRTFRAGERVGWYNGTILYRDLSTGNHPDGKLYGPRFLSCSVARFKMYALQIEPTLDGLPVFLVPGEFCSATKINDPRASSQEQGAALRKANVIFREGPVAKETVVNPFIVEIVALRDIRVDEELFVDYGPTFAGWASLSGNVLTHR